MRSQDRGKGGAGSEGEEPVKFDDHSKDGKRQSMSGAQRLTAQWSMN